MRRIVFVTLLALSAASMAAATRTWTGAQGNNWSNPANWSPVGLPAPGESLSFPAWAPLHMVDDLPSGTVVGPMSFEGEGSLTGNALTLTGDIGYVSSPSAAAFPISNDLTLGANITIYQAFGKSFNGAIDVHGYTLRFSPAYSTVLRAPLRGSGTILIEGTGLNVTGGGSFSGTIDGRLNLTGSYPNASIRSPRFSGNGTAGAVHAGLLDPGDAPPLPSTGGDHVIGTLRTGSLTIDPAGAKENGGAYNSNPKGRLLLDLVPGGASDQLIVRGTVTLDASLEITLLGAPAPGESFTIIENDGTDAVSGRFTGLSEGAMFTVGSSTLWISYRGGDGNDVVITAGTPPPTAKTWTGATSANWSEPTNWSPVGVPGNGDALHFPAGARLTTNNDLSGFVTGPMKFDDDYVLSGNAIALTGDLLFGGSTVDFVCNAPLALRTSLRFQQAGSARFNGAIDMAGYNLAITTKRTSIHGPISGTGELLAEGEGLTVAGSGPFQGRFRGRLDITGVYPSATVDGLLGATTGSATVAAIAATSLSPGSTAPCCADSHAGGVLNTQWLSIINEGFFDLYATGTSDQVRVHGPVALYGKLEVTVHGALTAPAYTIIDKTSSDAIYGTFLGLPEGATFYAGDEKFTITYKGGDGNDVVLTRFIAPPVKTTTTTTLTQSRATSEVHQPVTFTATVAATAGVPAGTVTFLDGATTLGTVALQNGVAELTTKTLSEGTHAITASYGGNDAYAASASAPVTHRVVRGNPTVTITALTPGLVHGDAASYRVDVTSGDERLPAGRVTLSVESAVAGSALLASGSVTIDVPAMTAGEHTVIAAYEGNEEFAAASAHLVQTVANAQTVATLSSNKNPSKAGDAITVTMHVTTPGRPALQPTGSVTFRRNGEVVSESALANGVATASIGSLAAGTYEITASYSGAIGFDAATAMLTQVVDTADPTKTATTTTLTQNRATSEVHQPVTFTATVTSAAGAPQGDIAFTADGTPIGSVALENGVAELTIKTLAEGTHTIAASYAGNDTFASSASTPLSHRVVKGDPKLTITASAEVLTHGDGATFRIDVSTKDERVATGRVSLSVDGVAAGRETLAGGSATLAVPMLRAGEHTIAASYEGNDELAPKTTSITRTVAKAKTMIAATVDPNLTVAGNPVDVTVHVNAARPSLDVEGSVMLRRGTQILGDATLAHGVAVVRIDPFDEGAYDLTAVYKGSDFFEPANAGLHLEITEPVVSVPSQNFDEGNGTHEVAVQIRLTGTSRTPVAMEYRTVDGTALAATDYEAAHGTVVVPPGASTVTVPIRVMGDVTPEPDETFAIELMNAVGARITTASTAIVIRNDEPMHREPVTYTYATIGDVPLHATFYAPLEGEGPRPLILFIPGDLAYDAQGDAAPALRLAERGYAVMSVEYRPAGTARFPAQIHDLAAAVRWLRANAAELNVDATRISAWGAGAGGHLATLLGAGMTDARIDAVVAFGAISNPATLQSDAPACTAIDWNAALSALLGCSPAACPATADAAAAAMYAGAGDAALLLMHGAHDCAVGPQQSQRLYDAVRLAGGRATLHVVEGAGHDVGASGDAIAEAGAFLDAAFSPSRRRTVRR